MNQSVKARDLLAIGYKEDKILGMAMEAVAKMTDAPKGDVMAIMKRLKDYPESFLDDEVLQPVAASMIEAATIVDTTIPLNDQPHTYAVYGAEHIEDGARRQMDVAMKLPVTVAGA